MGDMKWYVLRAAGGKEKKAKEYLERAKAADPTEAQSKWSYALDRCQYLIDSLK